MNSFGKKIRELREEKSLPLRSVAGYLDIDQAVLSKIERSQRKASRVQVKKLAKFFKVAERDLMVAWLSDKLVHELEDESTALLALQVAEEKMSYGRFTKADTDRVLKSIKDFLKKDGRTSKAWVFGSFARGEFTKNSDIDLMVRFKRPDQVSLFDYGDISYRLEKLLGVKVDLVEEGYLQPFALKTAQKDLKAIL